MIVLLLALAHDITCYGNDEIQSLPHLFLDRCCELKKKKRKRKKEKGFTSD